MRRVQGSSLLFILTYLASITAAEDCYFANGTVVPPRFHVLPCDNAPVKTICCALDRENPPGGLLINGNNTRDECLPNGICQNRAVRDGEKITAYWLNFCTDKDITSGKCLDVCRETRNDGGGSPMTPCDGTNTSTRWCCGTSTTCCTNNFGVVELPQSFIGRAISSTSSTAPSPTSANSISPGVTSPSQTAPSAQNPTPDQKQNTGLQSGVKAGIGIGIAVGVFALIGGIWFVRKAMAWRKKAKAQDMELLKRENPSLVSHSSPDLYKHEHGGNQRSEMPYWTKPTELASPGRPWELADTAVRPATSELKS
ncbi:hypothetical protein CC80DRAFT_594624 [Byssothecium circinans]|uniref:Mid2 domain-containing protein n=1 Tax=Byssothecium circinans TaxID=147558 RepID=A0A6A5TTB2_9PLEO|nr:hypothetical protein CC80DRAFT_594624 [Byssothecium circinans]